jgi:hypothetical protein
LTPFIDKNKILRVSGRLENATELYESRHPIVLDPDHHLSILLITEAHVQTAHAGVKRTLVEVRAKYWPLKGRRAIRRVAKKCVEWKIQRARPAPPMMAPLPRPRLEPFQPAFASVGLDFFGPYSVVIGRRREMFPLNENLKLARKSKISCIVFDLSCVHINEHGVLGIIEVVVPEKE